jgi:hypothetical protein
MNRVLSAARLHLVHPLVILGIPWTIVSTSFGINWAIWELADLRAQPHSGITGGVSALYVTVLVVYAQAVTQLLPFGMGMSLSRRAFYLGTALVAVVQSLGYGIAISALTAVEGATNGWGAGLSFWAPGPLDVDNAALQVLVSGAPMLAFAFAGVGMGVVNKRWGPSGTWGLIIGVMLLFGALGVLVTWRRAWGDIGSWFADQSVATLTVGLPVALAAILAALAFAGIRRVVP